MKSGRTRWSGGPTPVHWEGHGAVQHVESGVGQNQALPRSNWMNLGKSLHLGDNNVIHFTGSWERIN